MDRDRYLVLRQLRGQHVFDRRAWSALLTAEDQRLEWYFLHDVFTSRPEGKSLFQNDDIALRPTYINSKATVEKLVFSRRQPGCG